MITRCVVQQCENYGEPSGDVFMCELHRQEMIIRLEAAGADSDARGKVYREMYSIN